MMDVSLGAMAAFALAGAVSPGPVNVLATQHGARLGVWRAQAFVVGASLSYMAVVALAGLGLQQLWDRWPLLAQGLPWACAAYLLYLAWRLVTAPVLEGAYTQRGPATPAQAWRGFVQGWAVQFLNPKAWMVALSAVGVFVAPSAGPQRQLALLCGVSLLACQLGVGCWAVLGQALARWLAPPRRQRLFHALMAAALVLAVWGVVQ